MYSITSTIDQSLECMHWPYVLGGLMLYKYANKQKEICIIYINYRACMIIKATYIIIPKWSIELMHFKI